MTIRTPSSPSIADLLKPDGIRTADPLLALVRLLARQAAAEAVEDTKTDQHVTADAVPRGTGYLTDV